MKILKFSLRFWITFASIFSFVGGWIMLAHAPKPAQLFPDAAPTLAPLPPLFDMADNTSHGQFVLGFQPQQRNPFFRTGGS